jgi:uncharacterized integral membrane protein
MRTVFILGLMLLAVIFAVQNADVVSVDFMFWKLNASLAVLAAVCITVGVLLGVLIVVPRIYRMRADQRRLRAQLAEFEPSVASQSVKPKFQAPGAASRE